MNDMKLFSGNGRIPRRDYIACTILFSLLCFVILFFSCDTFTDLPVQEDDLTYKSVSQVEIDVYLFDVLFQRTNTTVPEVIDIPSTSFPQKFISEGGENSFLAYEFISEFDDVIGFDDVMKNGTINVEFYSSPRTLDVHINMTIKFDTYTRTVIIDCIDVPYERSDAIYEENIYDKHYYVTPGNSAPNLTINWSEQAHDGSYYKNLISYSGDASLRVIVDGRMND